MAEGIEVAKVGGIGDDEAIVVPRATAGTVDDIAVYFSGGEYFATDRTCTHEEAPLDEGWIEGGTVECPFHSANFCLRDGRALTPPASRDLAVHTVTVDGDRILLTPNPARLA